MGSQRSTTQRGPARAPKVVADKRLPAGAQQPYTTRMLNASARPDTALNVFYFAPTNATRAQLRATAVDENMVMAPTMAARKSAWSKLSSLYVMDRRSPEFRAMTDALAHSTDTQERTAILMLMAMRNDATFREVMAHPVARTLGMLSHGSKVDLAGLKRAISSHLFLLSDERQLQWSMPQVKKLTDTTVARLRAFGVLGRALKGGVAVTRASSTFQREALIFAAHLHYLSGGHNHNLLGSPYFRGLGLGMRGAWNTRSS